MSIPTAKERVTELLRTQRVRLNEMKNTHVSRDGMADDELRALDARQAGEKMAMREIENHIANLAYLLESPDFYVPGVA